MKFAAIVIIFVSCLLQATVSGAAGPAITVEKKDHDFGEVRSGRVVQTRVNVANKGDAPLIIDEIRTSCGCTKAVSAGREVLPREETDIAISYDSTGLTSGKKTQTVFIYSNDAKNPVAEIRVFADIVHDVIIDPTSLVVRLPRFQEHITVPMTARNNSQQSVILSVSGSQGAISKGLLQPEEVTVGPNSEVRIKIELELTKPEKGNVLAGELSIGTDHPDIRRIGLRCLIKIDRME